VRFYKRFHLFGWLALAVAYPTAPYSGKGWEVRSCAVGCRWA